MSIATIFLCVTLLPQLVMVELLDFMKNPDALMEWFLSGTLLIGAVLLLRWLLKDKVSCRVRYALWLVVLVRLLLPLQFDLPVAVSSAQLAPEPPAFLDAPAFTYTTPAPTPVFPEPQPEPSPNLPQNVPTPTPVPGNDLHIILVEDVFLGVWRGGMLLIGGILVVSNAWFDLRQIRRRKVLEVPESPIPIYTLEDIPSPCLFGPFRPAVYLTPEDAADETKLRHILAHELTHYAHKDHVWAVLRCICLTIHWFNPLVWVAVWLSKRDCELACDEGAVKRLGEEERIAYGRTLVDMVAQSGKASILSCSTTMTEGKKTIQQRIERLVKHPETKKTALFLAVSLLAVAAVFTFTGDEPTAKELGIPTSEEAYLRFMEQLESDDSASLLQINPNDSTISHTFHGSYLPQAKQLLKTHQAPLSSPANSIQTETAENASHVLHLEYKTDNDVYSTAYYMLPMDSQWYICREDWDWEEHRWLIPVATISEDVLSTLDDLLQQQAAQSSGISLFLNDLNDLFHVFQYDESVDINRYSFFLSISEQEELDAAKLLLAASCVPWEEGTEVPREHTPNYILLDTDDSTSPAPEYMIESYDSGSFLYRADDRHSPIAAIPSETITELRKLADPDQTPRVVMGVSILGTGNNQYTLNDPVSIAQLAQLLVNDPDTVALNRHPSYDMTDWLTNWTTRCFVEYGIKVLSRDRTEGWYIQASTAGGSSYFIDVPEHLVKQVKAVCERLDNYLTYDIPFNFAQYVHYAPSANSNILVSEIPRDTVLAIDELLGGAVLSDGTESLSVMDADGILDFRLPTEKEKLFFFLQEDGDRCLASAVRKIESGAMEHPVTHILPAGTSEVLRGIVDTQATTGTPTKVKYTIENRALITQLSQLFLNDPETVARNESPDYDMADWLTNWTNAYVIYYGTEYCPAGYEEGWYARAVDAGSWYFIQIPDHLVNEILSICRKNEA